jgi:hypothetical protein
MVAFPGLAAAAVLRNRGGVRPALARGCRPVTAGKRTAPVAALLVAADAALGCYALAVWLGEGRRASELALRQALPGIAIGAALGLLMMAFLMGVLVVTGAYDITVVGTTPA